MGDYGRAESLVRRALQIDRKSLELTSAVQSERQQLIMIRTLRSGLDLFLSLAPQANSEEHSGVSRGAGVEGVCLRSPAADPYGPKPAGYRPGGGPALRRVRTDHEPTGLSRPQPRMNPRQDQTWKRQIQELTEKKEQLEERPVASQLRVRRVSKSWRG